jgi:hypothetical protein
MPDVQPNTTSQFILYAAVFRLAVVGVGIASVVFGYRLLSKAVGPQSGAAGAVVASIGTAHLTLQNLAPGTMFAAFGMIVVGVMLYQGMPELKQQKAGDSIVLRSESPRPETPDIAALTDRAMKLEQSGNLLAATEAYEEALDRLATPTNNLALLYLHQNRNSEALALARIAADLRPFRAGILDTLAEAYERSGNHAAALKTAEMAAVLDAKYTERLDALRRGERR